MYSVTVSIVFRQLLPDSRLVDNLLLFSQFCLYGNSIPVPPDRNPGCFNQNAGQEVRIFGHINNFCWDANLFESKLDIEKLLTFARFFRWTE